MNRSNPPAPAEVGAPPGGTPTQDTDDPFATFSEWSDEADEKAYGGFVSPQLSPRHARP
jgi:hypothetical protein